MQGVGVPLGCAPEPWALAAPPASAAARMAALGVGWWGGVRTAHGRNAHESFETAGALGGCVPPSKRPTRRGVGTMLMLATLAAARTCLPTQLERRRSARLPTLKPNIRSFTTAVDAHIRLARSHVQRVSPRRDTGVGLDDYMRLPVEQAR